MSTLEELLASLDDEQRKALLAQLGNDDLNRSSRQAVLADIDTISPRASAAAPLSSAQRGLWFLHQLRPADSAYNICYAIDWPQAPDVAALSAALDDLTSRHEILRTTFPAGVGGEPSQVVLPALHVPLAEIDLADEDVASHEKWTHSTSVRPFDLERGPLIRTTLIRSGARSTLVLAVHHIVFDARSSEILLTELVALYRARVTGRPAGLDPLPVQYGDFAAWQHDRLAANLLDQDRSLGQHRAYWHDKLAGLQALALPADRQRSWERTSAGAVRPFAVPGELRSRLVAVARQREATLFMVLLAGFVALLHRYTGREDLAVGTSVSSRNRPELEGLIGYFLNTLVLRCDLSAGLSFGDLVEQVRQTVLDAFEHQDLPFEQLVEDLAPERELGVLPLVPVLFAFNASRSAGQPAVSRLAGRPWRRRPGRASGPHPHPLRQPARPGRVDRVRPGAVRSRVDRPDGRTAAPAAGDRDPGPGAARVQAADHDRAGGRRAGWLERHGRSQRGRRDADRDVRQASPAGSWPHRRA